MHGILRNIKTIPTIQINLDKTKNIQNCCEGTNNDMAVSDDCLTFYVKRTTIQRVALKN